MYTSNTNIMAYVSDINKKYRKQKIEKTFYKSNF